MYVEVLVCCCCSFGGKPQVRCSLPLDAIHLFRTEQIKRVEPTFSSFRGTHLRETTANLEDIDLLAVTQRGNRTVLPIQLRA